MQWRVVLLFRSGTRVDQSVESLPTPQIPLADDRWCDETHRPALNRCYCSFGHGSLLQVPLISRKVPSSTVPFVGSPHDYRITLPRYNLNTVFLHITTSFLIIQCSSDEHHYRYAWVKAMPLLWPTLTALSLPCRQC